jgi:hypothetical protein
VAAGAKPAALAAPGARTGPGPGAGFAAVAAKEIDEVVFFDPPRFSLVTARENQFIFYGKGANQFEELRCERSAAFEFIASANIAGGIHVGICAREARRVRELAAGAQPGLKAVIGQISQSSAKLDAAALDKLGWNYTRNSSANGAEEHHFAVVALGHGLLSVPTVVLVPKGGRQAVIVQAEAMRLCENYGLQNQTPLCGNTRQALTDIARRLAARFPD